MTQCCLPAEGVSTKPAEQKTSVEDPLEMERLAGNLPASETAKRWIVSTDPDEQSGSADMWSSASSIWCSTRPDPISNASCGSTPDRSCRGCARASADDRLRAGRSSSFHLVKRGGMGRGSLVATAEPRRPG